MARTSHSFVPPIMEARGWLDGVQFSADRPLLNLSQAAPTGAPPEGLRAAIADAAMHQTAAHLYGAVLGRADLRAEVAAQWSNAYGGRISAQNVAITSGCNQAFCAALATLCDEGDEVILPTPWYFNHKMWCDMNGIRAVPLPTEPDLLPDPDRAATVITPGTRAIVLVTPNNPGGVEYPADLVRAFHDLARRNGIALIVDETYRDFDSRPDAPHDLFTDPDWDDTLIQLYSFSKAYRLTGHRVGAMVASPARLAEAEKFLDCVTICPNQLGQIGALWGMQNLSQWLAGERSEILSRRSAIEHGMPRLAKRGWELKGVGAYFAYITHPYAEASDILAPRLVQDAGVLLLPGTMFTPRGDATGARHFRVAFANVDGAGIDSLFDRLEVLDGQGWPLAPKGPSA